MPQNWLLFTSALRDDTNALEQALKQEEKERERQGLDVNMRSEETGSTALRMAVGGGNINSVKVLLKYGANPNLGDNRDKTPLHSIVLQCKGEARKNKEVCFEIATLLLEAGADPDAKIKNSAETPLSFVKDGKTDDEKRMKALLERYRKQPDLTAIEPVVKREDSEMPASQKAEQKPSVPPRKSKSWPSTEREANLDENAGDDVPLLSNSRYSFNGKPASSTESDSQSQDNEKGCMLM